MSEDPVTDPRTPFLEEVLLQADYDWCDASYLYGLALDEVAAGEPARELVLDTLRDGIARGWLQAGDLVATGGEPALRFEPWTGSAGEVSDRFSRAWRALPSPSPEPDSIGWVTVTDAGERVAREVEARREADGADGDG